MQFGSLQRTTPATFPRRRTYACQFPSRNSPQPFWSLGEGAGLRRTLGSALGKSEEGRGWGTAVLSHTARMLRFEWEGVMRGEKWRQWFNVVALLWNISCHLGEHTLFIFKMSVLLSRLSFVGLYFMCMCVYVVCLAFSADLRWQCPLMVHSVPVRNISRVWWRFSWASRCSIFVKCFSSPNCRISGLFGSGADRFVLVWVF